MVNGDGSQVRITDGSAEFSGGIDSGRIPTIEGPQNPNGLKRNMLAWMTNASVRGGAVLQRTGWLRRCSNFSQDTGLFQGASFYVPDAAVPYIVASISGRIVRFRVFENNAVDDITGGGGANPATQVRSFFCQGEQFMIIQAGDFVTNPKIWDGTNMRRSNGYTGVIATTEIPAGAAMDYWQGRLWVQNGNRTFTAGDIVYGPTGTAPYQNRDSILKWQENAFLSGGGNFSVPSLAGQIRALKHTANLDNSLGDSNLYVFTRDSIYSMDVPITRTDWTAVNANTLPKQRLAQQRYGSPSDWSIVPVNTDLFYRSFDGVRSLQVATRYFHQWGQTPLSRNENRVLAFDDRSLLRFASGVEFDNRLLETVNPFQTDRGVCHRGLIPLDFDLITSLETKLPPAWEGMYEGLDFLQILKGDSGGLERCFGFVRSRETGKIEVWELTNYSKVDGDEDTSRVNWYIETPAYTWGNSFQLKELDSLELWLDKISSTVNFEVYYRVDQNPCWILWDKFQTCSADNTCEDVEHPVCYPKQSYCEGYKATFTLPKPPMQDVAINNHRPSTQGYQFQIKIVLKGWCRIRGLLVHAFKRDKAPYEGMV